MPLSETTAAELAGLLPDELRCDDARERLLCVARLLQALTDEHHLLSNADIRAILRARFGDEHVPAENTLAADIRAIQHGGSLGLEVHIEPRGCWCERTDLTPSSVRLLLNAVQASRFLTSEQSAQLQEDLFCLVSRHQEDDLAGEVHVDQRVRRSYQHVFDTIDAVSRAIHSGRKIEFRYTFTDFAGRSHDLPGDDGETLRVETPIALYFSENNYYVETYASTPWRHGTHHLVSRADRMVGTCVSAQEADRCRAVYDLRRSAKRRMAESFDMVHGPLRRVFLRVRSDATNLLYDRFGFGLRFGQFEHVGEGPDATALTLLSLPQAHTFYRWLSGVGNGIVMVTPPPELVLRSGPWARSLQGVTREELVADHEAMVEGFLAFLDRARSAYEG